MQKYILLFLTLFGVILMANTQIQPPVIQCISSTQAGDLTIHWTPISGLESDFLSYTVEGVSGGSYGIITNMNVDVFTIPSGGLSLDQFYISTTYVGEFISNSDTVKNIYLELNNAGNGVAQLIWNKPLENQLDEFNDFYHIYKEYPIGTWSLIDSIPYYSTQYVDTITVCEEKISYKIVLPTTTCDFQSNIQGDIFEDKIVPNIPIITNVDIDTISSNITINWDKNKQPDTYGYVIYQTNSNGNVVEKDTVWGRENTSYTYYENPENGPFQFSIAAFDSCYTINIPPTYQTSGKAEPHTTSFLTTDIEKCARKLHLNWSRYIGFSQVATQNVFLKINDADWQKVGETQNTSFSYELEVGDNVKAVIQTVSEDSMTSFSNVSTIVFVGSPSISINYLGVATVENNNVKIKHRIALAEGVTSIALERQNPTTLLFNKIDEKEIDGNGEIDFIDKEAEVNRRSYVYRTQAFDTCGIPLDYTNIGETIFLNVITDNVEEKHTLQWSPYRDFLGGVVNYEIYRGINGDVDPTPIATVPYYLRTFTDNVSNFDEISQGRICYIVAAVEGSNQFGFPEKSFSNQDCAVIEPSIFIPNAFTVDRHNPIFKPITRQRKVDNYHFVIYDRYGRTVFQTNDVNEGWDGILKGTKMKAETGVYVYKLSLRDGNGVEVLKYGHVTLLR